MAYCYIFADVVVKSDPEYQSRIVLSALCIRMEPGAGRVTRKGGEERGVRKWSSAFLASSPGMGLIENGERASREYRLRFRAFENALSLFREIGGIPRRR